MSEIERRAAASRTAVHWFRRSLLLLFLLASVVAVALAGIEWAKRNRESACRKDLEHLHWSLDYYYENHHHFPPPYLTDRNGRPMHSWRALLLSPV